MTKTWGDLYMNVFLACCYPPPVEEGLLGGSWRHSGPVCDWGLSGERKKDRHLWGLPAGLLR